MISYFTEDNIIHDTTGHKYKFINTRAIGLIGGLFLRTQLEGILEALHQDPNFPDILYIIFIMIILSHQLLVLQTLAGQHNPEHGQ